jgi:gluconate 2-dehydrogenase gamma chain
MADDTIPRRKFLLGAGIAGTAVAAGIAPNAEAQTPAPAAAPVPANEPVTYLTLSALEAAFLSAVADTMIPADELSPSGTDCGVVVFIDRQLAGSYGGGAKLYRSGPFRKGKPEHGYQLPLTPREFVGVGIAATNDWVRKVHRKDFHRLSPKEREDALKALEAGKAELGDFDGRQFFDALINLVMEGFFSDPIYGGNRNKAAWKMIGYPGLPALYANSIDEYRHKRYLVEPQSIADFS